MPNELMKPAIFFGEVFHRRFFPKIHSLNYSMFQILLDIDDLANYQNDLKAIKFNRFGLLSFFEKDYGPIQNENGNLGERIRAILPPNQYKIMLLTMPRFLGFVFNPISIYFIISDEQKIEFIIYEVSNTFGDRHSYVQKIDFETDVSVHKCDKKLHVSPFMATAAMEYKFKMSYPNENFHFGITLTDKKMRQKYLYASFHARSLPLNDFNLWKMFWCVPIQTFKVVIAIHLEAIKILSKGIFLKPKPKTPKNGVSFT